MPGVFSAYGILVSDIRAGYTRSILRPLSGSENLIRDAIADLKNQASSDLKKQGIMVKDAAFYSSLDLRYKGQSYEINVDLREKVEDEFHQKHERLYGYAMPSEPLELVNVRLFTVHLRSKPLSRALATGTNEPEKKRMVLFEGGSREITVFSRDNLIPGFNAQGPAVVEENTATTVVPPDCAFHVDDFGVIHMEVS
jgi:N-methylhydantoinase A